MKVLIEYNTFSLQVNKKCSKNSSFLKIFIGRYHFSEKVSEIL